MQIRGTFEEVTLVDLARLLAAARQTGVLSVFAEPTGRVAFIEGHVDFADRSGGSHQQRLTAFAAAPDPFEERRMLRDRLAELIHLARSRATFSFSPEAVRPSGLPPFDLSDLADRRTAAPADGVSWSAAPAVGPSAHAGPAVAPASAPSAHPSPAPAPAAAPMAQPLVSVAARAPEAAAPPRPATSHRHAPSRSRALSRLIGAVRRRQGES